MNLIAPNKENTKIRQFPELELLIPSVDVKKFGQRLIDLCKVMIEFMEKDDGIGLAAPQICYNLNLIVLGNALPKSLALQPARFKLDYNELGYVLVNPRLKSFSEKKVDLLRGEGCLSLMRADLGKVERNEWIALKYQDLNGNEFEARIEGGIATVVLHEIDHLHGILYPGRMKESERNTLLARYIMLKNLNHIEVVNAIKLMSQNVKNYDANRLSEKERSVDDLVAFAHKIHLPEARISQMLEKIFWVNDDI